MKSYRDLDVYKLSYNLAIDVHKLSLNLPQYELFEEGSQVRRASQAITASIVEGYGRNRYKAEFVRFLIYALGSCDETTVHLNFIKDTHSGFEEQVVSLLNAYDELGRKINKFIDYVEESWNEQLVTSNK
jgi:four helix bundle protein